MTHIQIDLVKLHSDLVDTMALFCLYTDVKISFTTWVRIVLPTDKKPAPMFNRHEISCLHDGVFIILMELSEILQKSYDQYSKPDE